jgi:ferredoxin
MTGPDSTNLHIDWTACDGRGTCTELLPEVLDRDPWGYPMPRDGSREPVVAPELARHARRADYCPRLALRLVNRPNRQPPG